ncbi:MAG: transporter related protein [Lachnospiraceae bacterium]|jgi:simple sugar transport system ATP-binding protein|nr:transporter related protein [Lachnospiraceae bacterium]
MNVYHVELKEITKRFSGFIANDHINLSVKRGEIHSLLGENGAGKTTLMKILLGLYSADEGSLWIDGKEVHITNPRIAFQLGIGMVHQHFMLVNNLSVLENIILGQEPGNVSLDLKKSYKIVQELSTKYNFALDLNAKVEELSVGMKQRVEILKILYRGADIIILDEPTAVLTPQEADQLMKILHDMKLQGKTIIFITHKLNETMEVADRITVLRNGKNVITVNKEDTTPEELAKFMVGRDICFTIEKSKKKRGKPILSIENVKLLPQASDTVSLSVHEGEILGIAGVEGNGQRELEEIILGLRKYKNGMISLLGTNINSMTTKVRKDLGIGYIPSDRHKRAMLSNFTIADNYLLGYHFRAPFSSKGILKKQEVEKHSKDMIECFQIKVSGLHQSIGSLSGGNQQKVIVSREVSQNPHLIIAAQPTRGLDIGAIEYIHNQLLRLRDEGKAILLISAELSEILKLSDRIGVLYKGELMELKETDVYAEGEIGLLMAGRKAGIGTNG